MKKLFLFLLLPFSLFSQDEYIPLVDTNQAVTVQIGHYEGSSLVTADTITSLSDVPFRFFTTPLGVRFTSLDGYWSLATPNMLLSNNVGNRPGSLSYTQRPILDNSNGLAYPYKYFPSLQALYRFIESCYIAGVGSTAFVQTSRVDQQNPIVYLNVDVPTLIAECLSGTNGAFRSSVVDLLSSLRNSSSASVAHLDDISNSLVDFSSSYEKVNFYDFNTFDSVVDYASSAGYVSSSHAQSLKDHYSALASDPAARQSFDRATRDYLRSAARVSNDLDKLLSDDRIKDVGDSFNSGLQNEVASGVSGAAHFHGVTTNMLQRMTNQTEQIKQDLQAWRTDATNRLERQWDGIKKIQDNTGNTAAGVSQIANNGVKIVGPVEFVQTTGQKFSVNLTDANLSTINNSIADGAKDAMRLWLAEWDLFKDSQYPYMARFSSFIGANTNLLSSIDTKLEFGFTNIFDSIYAALTNLDIVASTNSYVLLSDYADYISSSGLSDLLDVLDDDEYSDFKSAVDSIGHADVAEGYGRWWRYFTGLSTVQANSIFKLSNIFQAHEKLLGDLKRDNSDVSDLSNASVFRDLLSKIPSQTEIDSKLSQLTNSIDSSGFTRLQELIPDLTNSLSEVSDLYNKDFALPTDISWVLIPADSSLNLKERVIHINPYEYRRVFDVLHYGIAFAYCIVNILLLPKFLLFLVHLFDRVWNKSEKLIYNSTQS